MRGLTFDAGALLAIEKGDQRVRALVEKALREDIRISVPAGVVAQTWRGGPRQARLAMLINDHRVHVVPLDLSTARAVGEVCAHTMHPDVVDVSVYLCARDGGDHIVTSDPSDMRRIDPRVSLIEI